MELTFSRIAFSVTITGSSSPGTRPTRNGGETLQLVCWSSELAASPCC